MFDSKMKNQLRKLEERVADLERHEKYRNALWSDNGVRVPLSHVCRYVLNHLGLTLVHYKESVLLENKVEKSDG